MSTIACPVCGRRITTSGVSQPPTRCPACGASLLATDPAPSGARDDQDERDVSDTRPVPLDEFSTRPVSPSPASASAPDKGATRDLPSSALPRPPAPGRGRRLMWGLSAGALVVLLLAAVAVAALAVNGALPFSQRAAAPTATATAAGPTATPASVTYSPAGLYSIAYPTGWSKVEQNNSPNVYKVYSVTFINPSSGASLSVTAQQTPSYIDAATYDKNYLDSLAHTTGTRPQNLSAPQAVTLARQTWTQESADVAIETTAGTRYAYAIALTTNHGGYAYTIVYLVPWLDQAGARSAFDTANQTYFQPMLATFTFLR